MWYLVIFALGSAIGSFVNVLVTRSVKGLDWVGGRSRCDYCNKPLACYDLIPLLSYAAYRGKSRCCGKMLSYRHPLVELMFGTLFVWWAVVGVAFFHLISHPYGYAQPMFWLLTGILLGIVFVTDWFYGLVSTNIIYLGSALTIGYRLILIYSGTYEPRDLILSVLAMVTGALLMIFLRAVTRGRGMGEGDIYLAGWVGLLVGWPRVLVALWVAFVVGAVVSLILVVVKKKRIKETVPFGPFLVAGVLVALIFGTRMLEALK